MRKKELLELLGEVEGMVIGLGSMKGTSLWYNLIDSKNEDIVCGVRLDHKCLQLDKYYKDSDRYDPNFDHYINLTVSQYQYVKGWLLEKYPLY